MLWFNKKDKTKQPTETTRVTVKAMNKMMRELEDRLRADIREEARKVIEEYTAPAPTGARHIKKECPSCGLKKSLRAFSRDDSRDDGVKVYCRLCIRDGRAPRGDGGVKRAATGKTEASPPAPKPRKPRVKLGRRQRENVVRLLDKKTSDIAGVAKFYGVHYSTVARIYREAKKARAL